MSPHFSLHVCVLTSEAAPNNAVDTDCSSPVLGPGAGGVVGVSVVLVSRWWCCWWCWRSWCVVGGVGGVQVLVVLLWNNSVVKLCIFWQT